MTSPFSPSQAPRPADVAAPVAPPPSDVPLVQRVAEILLAYWALGKTVDAITALLAPYKVSRTAVQAALGLAKTAHVPHAVLSEHGLSTSRARSAPAQIARNVARQDVYFRAAYVVKASGRMQRELDDGKPLAIVLRGEARHFEAHRRARRKRLDAAAGTAKAAAIHGPLLGWYRNPLLDSDLDCRVADGHNFYADQGTVIGLPGSVHPECGCSAGPPHENGQLVNDVLAGVLGTMPASSAPRDVLKLRRRTA